MTITWRNVDAPNQATANQMITSGSETMLNSFDKLTGIVKKKQEEQDALMLGQLQAATAGVGASDDIKAILGAGMTSGMGGAQLSALASGAVAQGKTLFDQGLDADKLYAQKEQFNASQVLSDKQHKDELSIKASQLANQVAGTQADISNNAAQLDLKREELRQRVGESAQDYKLRLRQVDGTINNNVAELKQKQGEIDAKALLAKQTRDLMNSSEYIAATPQQRQEALASLAPDAETAAKIINAAIPKDGEGGKGSAVNVTEAMKYFENPEAKVPIKDQIKIRGLMDRAKEAGIPLNAVTSYVAEKSDMDGFFDQNIWGDSDMETDVLLSDVNKYALANGWVPKGSKVDARAILPQDMPIPVAKQK